MKILYLITKSHWGGAQRYVFDLATHFCLHKCDVSVSVGGNGLLVERLIAQGVTVHPVRHLIRDISLKEELLALIDLYKLIKRERPDILHVNSSKAAGLGAFLGRVLGIKTIVFTVHGAPFREDRSYATKRMMYFLTWITCLLSHKVITVSKQDEADIAEMAWIKRKVTTIYMGLTYTPKERITPKSRASRILSIGDLTKNKGHIYALQAVELLRNSGIEFTYSIIGEGEDRNKLEEYISMKQLGDVVTLLGYQDGQSALPEYDIYLLSSVKEGLPYTLLEAGRVSLPVVATITGGIPEIIQHEKTGLLVHPKDVEAMAEALKRVISDRHFAKRLGQDLHSHVMSHFSHAKMMVETAKVYGLIEGKK